MMRSNLRRAVLLGGVLALGTAMLALASPAPARPDPTPKLISVRAVAASATAFWVKLYWQAPGSPDSILTRITGGTGFGHRLRGTVTRDSFSVTMPTLGSTATGTGCVQSKRIYGGLSNEVCGSWTYTNAGSPPPPPVIDSVRTDTVVVSFDVQPPGKDVMPLAQQQYCAFAVFGNGQVAQRSSQKGIQTCDYLYGYLYTPGQRAITALQQQKADALCPHWATTDPQGTVTLEPCDPTRGA